MQFNSFNSVFKSSNRLCTIAKNSSFNIVGRISADGRFSVRPEIKNVLGIATNYKSFIILIAVCTCRIGAIRLGVRGARRGASGQALRQEVCTRVVRREACGPGHIRSCVTPDDLRPSTVKARTTRDRVESMRV